MSSGFQVEHTLVENAWSESPNGESYRQRLLDKERSGLLSWIDSWARRRVQATNKMWEEKIKARHKTQYTAGKWRWPIGDARNATGKD